MSSEANALRARVKQFAVHILKFVRTLPRDPAGDVLARQLARAGTGISSNYHSSGRARSRAEFIARLGIVVEEADETEHWLFVIRESHVASGPGLDALLQESGELRAIFSAALSTARRNQAGRSR
jgi:four helix bundle protein